MVAPYPVLNGTLVSNDLTYLMVYANSVTSGWFVPIMVIVFFLGVLITSLGLQFKYSSRIRPETSFVASCFATLAVAAVLEQRTGLLSPLYFIIIIAITCLSVLALIMSPD